jgi:hypothetical protein
MTRLLATVLATLLLGGCGISPTAPISYGEPPRAAPGGLVVYFVYHGRLFATVRSPPDSASVPSPLDLLTDGPLDADTAAGITTELPSGLRLAPQRTGTAPRLFVFSKTGPFDPNQLSTLATAQIACTTMASTVLGTPAPRSVTLQSKNGSRGPLTCPLNSGRPSATGS